MPVIDDKIKKLGAFANEVGLVVIVERYIDANGRKFSYTLVLDAEVDHDAAEDNLAYNILHGEGDVLM